MKKARIVIGANYGDEGKGTVVAHYTKHSEGDVLNVLTNGGAQRGHSILTDAGSITFQHFGSGTYHGADSYYSRFFILNPMQFAKEYNELIIKPKHIYRDKQCRWSTPYDSIMNLITEEMQGRHASCGMGIWNTIKRYNTIPGVYFDDFLTMDDPAEYLNSVKQYYERQIEIPSSWKLIWDSPILMLHFINDCKFMYEHTEAMPLKCLDYDNIIFENGQGLLLCDTGKDTYDTTPSNTGILYSLELLKDIPNADITAHYVTRPYLTRHGDGEIFSPNIRRFISGGIEEDRTNHFNDFQGEFRYGNLDISDLHKRIVNDSRNIKFELEVTHCDEMDRVAEFKKNFYTVNVYDSALIK
jgi:adenylosuccinate synthase